MDIILLFLAKPLDKHGTTLVHITYPPLDVGAYNESETNCVIANRPLPNSAEIGLVAAE